MIGEVENRKAERKAADSRYNEALTRLDQALPRLPELLPTLKALSSALDLQGLDNPPAIQAPALVHHTGWRGRLARFVWNLVEPCFAQQQTLNEQTHTHIRQTADAVGHLATTLADSLTAEREALQKLTTFDSILLQYLQQITPFVDTKIYEIEASLDEVRMAAISARRAAQATSQGTARNLQNVAQSTSKAELSHGPTTSKGSSEKAGSLGAGYIGFEDLFRGSSDDIRKRQADYAERLSGCSKVLDIGCGRGELLDLLREHGVTAIGVDANAEMVDVCVGRGHSAYQADGITYLADLTDNSLDGVTAIQVVEHLQPKELQQLLETTFDKLCVGGTLVLETINASCWVAFFESYIRDITHVRPLHPETLKFLVVAAGFEQVDIHFRSPVSETGRLQHVPNTGLTPELTEAVGTINSNIDRLNERLFTYLDFAVIGVKQG
tara:strand:- start:686 stop:2005 length:1320 start_codon:yes stop_codon:yes gene_type:complete